MLSIALLFPPGLRAQAKDLDSLVTVAIYNLNTDYLEFTIHRTALPAYWVVRELVCRIELLPKDSSEAVEVIELTDFPPHFFEYDKQDAVLYRAHKLKQPKLIKSSCLGGDVFASGDTSTAEWSFDTSDSTKGLHKTHTKERITVTSKDGRLTGSASTIRSLVSPTAKDLEFLADITDLGGAGLQEPKASDVFEALKSHSKPLRHSTTPSALAVPVPLGVVPVPATAPIEGGGIVDHVPGPPGEMIMVRPALSGSEGHDAGALAPAAPVAKAAPGSEAGSRSDTAAHAQESTSAGTNAPAPLRPEGSSNATSVLSKDSGTADLSKGELAAQKKLAKDKARQEKNDARAAAKAKKEADPPEDKPEHTTHTHHSKDKDQHQQ